MLAGFWVSSSQCSPGLSLQHTPTRDQWRNGKMPISITLSMHQPEPSSKRWSSWIEDSNKGKVFSNHVKHEWLIQSRQNRGENLMKRNTCSVCIHQGIPFFNQRSLLGNASFIRTLMRLSLIILIFSTEMVQEVKYELWNYFRSKRFLLNHQPIKTALK